MAAGYFNWDEFFEDHFISAYWIGRITSIPYETVRIYLRGSGTDIATARKIDKVIGIIDDYQLSLKPGTKKKRGDCRNPENRYVIELIQLLYSDLEDEPSLRFIQLSEHRPMDEWAVIRPEATEVFSRICRTEEERLIKRYSEGLEW